MSKKIGDKCIPALIIAGLWTEVCVAMPAIQAAGEGHDVFVVTDASGSFQKKHTIWLPI